MTVLSYDDAFENNIFDITFLFDDSGASPSVACCDHRHAVMDELTAAAFPQSIKEAVVPFALFDGSPRVIASPSEIIADPGQLRGLSIFTSGQLEDQFFQGAGATPMHFSGKIWHFGDEIQMQLPLGSRVAGEHNTRRLLRSIF
jgi:TRAP-type C4-dicarboxylate transport system substrate-binding protein